MTLPQKFIERMSERLGRDFPAFLKTYENPPIRGLKVNTLKVNSDTMPAFCGSEPVPWAEDAYYCEGERLGGSFEHFAGLFYLQEPSAMCAAPLLKAEPGERVLDLCAAPGGKSVQLACAMRGEGILVANEIDYGRARILSQNLERMGVENAVVTCAEPARLSEIFPAYFDKILVDAPCSGEGMFKKEENATKEWSEKNVLFCARRQAAILEEAQKMLCKGGRMVYSTCTFAEEEDEWQIAEFCRTHPAFLLEKQEKLYPHKVRGEGHFAALLSKREGERKDAKPYPIRKVFAANRAFERFCGEIFGEITGEITTFEDGRMYLMRGEFPALPHVPILRLGLEIGEWDGKLFRPAHALAIAEGNHAKRQTELGDEETEKYLHGEPLQRNVPDGWTVLTHTGFPLGFGKCVSGVIKNHFPKGLRLSSKSSLCDLSRRGKNMSS